jgi:glycosyltransferase involved in cell wall biosynthesis
MISVVIPTLNAAAGVPRCFDSLLEAAMRGLVREVIVSDGGSTDETLMLAEAAGARLVSASRCRGHLMEKGAEAARSDWLLFLRPDTVLEAGWEDEASAFIERSSLDHPRAAAFRFAVDDFEPRSRRLESIVALRCWLFGIPSGDQGLLIPRRLYHKLGGFSRIEAIEDIDFARRLGRKRIVMLRSRAITRAERFQPQGRLQEYTHNLGMLLLSALRVPTPLLLRLYG